MSELSEKLGIRIGVPVEMLAVAVKESAIRCKTLDSNIPITLRKVRLQVEGEILTVIPENLWHFGNTYHMSGNVKSVRIDIPALNLDPLALRDPWPWDPKEQYWGESGDPSMKYFKDIINFGPRVSYEMEQILPLMDLDDPFDDPIIEANDLFETGYYEEASRAIEPLLVSDIRCLDAHAHLGNWCFRSGRNAQSFSMEKAKKHYEIGVKIGEMSLPSDENIVLPWARIDNRPFLRCLHGYGLSLWRMGQDKEAREQYERLLWFNPSDNQGARFLLLDIDAGKTWEDVND